MMRRLLVFGLLTIGGIALGLSTWIVLAGALIFVLPWGIACVVVGAFMPSALSAARSGGLVAVAADIGFFISRIPWTYQHGQWFNLILNIVFYAIACVFCGAATGVIGYVIRRRIVRVKN